MSSAKVKILNKVFFLSCATITIGTTFASCLSLIALVAPAEARRAYSSYGDIDEKTLDNILNGKSPTKKAARPRVKHHKQSHASSTSSGADSGSVGTGGSITTSPISVKSSGAAKSSKKGAADATAVQPASQSANPNAASFAALAPVPTIQKGNLKGLSKKLSALAEMSPPTSLDMEREQALTVGAK